MSLDDEVALRYASTLDIYLPFTNEWRTVDNFYEVEARHEVPFAAQGRLHGMTEDAIHVYDVDANKWTCLHSFRIDISEDMELGPDDCIEIEPLVVLLVDDELLAIIEWTSDDLPIKQTSLFRSKGLGGEDKTFYWQKVQIPPAFANWPRNLSSDNFLDFFLSPVQV